MYYKDGKKIALPSWAKKGKTYTLNGKKNTFLLLKKPLSIKKKRSEN